ncbi:hypothetical protein L226DRAFT_537482 [Lentinus tigrinus ALCF2SS1-7]|uniref:Uncharacterized protein n=1 Tax=Lentinus tigrinus ALCF2SS1-6 TaxID=1328759 RepID=A0A5C2S3H3_9APHY|nr:hypothetical protein L227DRAFT_577992 [Lentinus tigrinus ALCF2SS1-6]RPD72053.1 hypothetical protein L226DRAFT_537482 [Lentinus tigrinus ALCF2SS1-7]
MDQGFLESWATELYQRILYDAVRHVGAVAQQPISIEIPQLKATLVMRLPGGAIETAEVVIPAWVVTLIVTNLEEIPVRASSGANAVAHAPPSPTPYSPEPVSANLSDISQFAVDIPHGPHMPPDKTLQQGSHTVNRSILPRSAMNFVPFEVSQNLDQTYASQPLWMSFMLRISSSPPRPTLAISQCTECAVLGIECWRTDPLWNCERCITYNLRCSDG